MSEPSRKRVEKELIALKTAIDNDIEEARLAAVTQHSPKSIVVKPGAEFKVSLNRISSSVRAELESQGYEVRSVKAPAFRLASNGLEISIPEREIFDLRAGKAKGPLAREISRAEKSLQEAAMSPSTRDSASGVYFDPAIMGITQTDALFSNGNGLPRGLHIGGKGFLKDQYAVVELIRHELRHAKAYFDLIAGRKTLGRGSLVDATEGRLLENTSGKPKPFSTAYSERFSIDEIDGFLSNVTSNQTRLRQLSKEGTDVDAIKISKTTALRRVQNVRTFVQATTDNFNKVRSSLQMARTPEDWSSMTTLEDNPLYPGIKKLTVTFLVDPKNPLRSADRKLELLIPDKVAEQGAKAQMTEVRQYIEDMTLKMFDVEKELAIRERQINSYPTP